MRNRILALTVAILALGSAQATAQDAPKNPNIVVIWGDDIGFTKFEHL